MTRKKYAFPLRGSQGFDEDGMELRDYFAAKAIEGTAISGVPDYKLLVERAYFIADLMIIEREKPSQFG